MNVSWKAEVYLQDQLCTCAEELVRHRESENGSCSSRFLLGTEFEASAWKTVAPHQSLFLPFAAEHSVFVLLCGDVLLPLSLAITVLTTQTAVKVTLQDKNQLNICIKWRICFSENAVIVKPELKNQKQRWTHYYFSIVSGHGNVFVLWGGLAGRGFISLALVV